MDSLENFETFASLNGPKFYGLETNDSTITLERKRHVVAEEISLPSSKEVIRPYDLFTGRQTNFFSDYMTLTF